MCKGLYLGTLVWTLRVQLGLQQEGRAAEVGKKREMQRGTQAQSAAAAAAGVPALLEAVRACWACWGPAAAHPVALLRAAPLHAHTKGSLRIHGSSKRRRVFRKRPFGPKMTLIDVTCSCAWTGLLATQAAHANLGSLVRRGINYSSSRPTKIHRLE